MQIPHPGCYADLHLPEQERSLVCSINLLSNLTMKRPYWTATRTIAPQFFHMVANEYAIFTQTESDAFRCKDYDDALNLCSALNETDPSDWKPAVVSDVCLTYTSDMTRPSCPTCGSPVEPPNAIHDPGTCEWIGVCTNSHTNAYQLDDIL